MEGIKRLVFQRHISETYSDSYPSAIPMHYFRILFRAIENVAVKTLEHQKEKRIRKLEADVCGEQSWIDQVTEWLFVFKSSQYVFKSKLLQNDRL
ncbi:MAG: hypothetical protein RLY14_1216 [Planctomycetota bacterium]|jgi:hypothetical protein